MIKEILKREYFRVNFDGNLEVMTSKDWDEEVIRFVNLKVLRLEREFGYPYNYRKFYDSDGILCYIERISRF